MYVGLKQPRGDGERYVTPARAAAKETSYCSAEVDIIYIINLYKNHCRTADHSSTLVQLITQCDSAS